MKPIKLTTALILISFLGFSQTQNSLIINDSGNVNTGIPDIINYKQEHWCFFKYNYIELNSGWVELVDVHYSNSNVLTWTSQPINHPDFMVQGAVFINEWTSNNKAIGIANIVTLADSTKRLAYFQWNGINLDWEIIQNSENKSFSGGWKIVENDSLYLLGINSSLNSSSREMVIVSRSGDFVQKSTTASQSIFSAVSKGSGDQILLSNWYDGISETNLQNTPASAFYEHTPIGTDIVLDRLININQIEVKNNRIYLGATAQIIREDFSMDSDGSIVKLSSTGEFVDYISFTELDSNGQGLYEYGGEISDRQNFSFIDDEYIVQVTTATPSVTNFLIKHHNHLLISKVDTNLNLIWTKKYIPEDSMSIHNLTVATQEDGSFVLINRVGNWKYQEEQGFNLQFLHFNKNGYLLGADLLPDFLQSNFYVYPNPSSSIFNLKLESPAETISIYDTNGKMVFQEENTLQVDLSQQPNGVYLIKALTASGHFQTAKIIKQ